MIARAIVDRFEGDYIVLEADDNKTVNIPKSNAPFMIAEGMIVTYENNYVVTIDHEATAKYEADMRKRFERLLNKNTD